MGAAIPDWVYRLLHELEDLDQPGPAEQVALEDLLQHWFAGAATEPPAPALPTCLPPGTAGKVEVLIGRYQRGEHLWHPDDPPDLPDRVGVRVRRRRNGSLERGDLAVLAGTRAQP